MVRSARIRCGDLAYYIHNGTRVPVKVGLVHSTTSAKVMVTADRGYFKKYQWITVTDNLQEQRLISRKRAKKTLLVPTYE